MHECERCGFKTSRLDALKRHLNRKNPCKKVNAGKCSVNAGVNVFVDSVNVMEPSVNVMEPSVNAGVNVRVNNTHDVQVKHICEICHKTFRSKQGKYQHKKNVNCKPPPAVCQPVVVDEAEKLSPLQYEEEFDDSTTCPYCEKLFSRVDSLKRHMVRCKFKYSGGTTNNTTNNNINNTTNNNTNSHNTTNNYTINYNSYDRPSIDHVTKEHVKELYLNNNRNLKKLIYAGVCEIWKKKENNSFKLPFQKKNGKVKVPKKLFLDNEPVEVYSDGKERLFPADHVVEVVLQKAAEVCESYLRQHYNEETIPGRGVLKHADVLEELACNFQEVWDDDKAFRSGYKPFVRTALLECMREKEEAEEAGEQGEEDAEMRGLESAEADIE